MTKAYCCSAICELPAPAHVVNTTLACCRAALTAFGSKKPAWFRMPAYVNICCPHHKRACQYSFCGRYRSDCICGSALLCVLHNTQATEPRSDWHIVCSTRLPLMASKQCGCRSLLTLLGSPTLSRMPSSPLQAAAPATSLKHLSLILEPSAASLPLQGISLTFVQVRSE